MNRLDVHRKIFRELINSKDVELLDLMVPGLEPLPEHSICYVEYWLLKNDVDKAKEVLNFMYEQGHANLVRRKHHALILHHVIGTSRFQKELAYFSKHFVCYGEDIIACHEERVNWSFLHGCRIVCIIAKMPDNMISKLKKATDIHLKKLWPSSEEKNRIINSLGLKELITVEPGYKYVVDGANILLSGCGKATMKNINKLKHLQDLGRCLFVFNERHRGYLTFLNQNNVFYSPKGVNDDLFIINIALTNNLEIISSDRFRDHKHLVGNNEFDWWLEDNLIRPDNIIESPDKFYSKFRAQLAKNFSGKTFMFVPTDNHEFWLELPS